VRDVGSSLRKAAVLLTLASAIFGCSSMPVQEVSDARQAITSARAAGGDRYTPQTLEQAERLIDQALADLALGHYHSARVAALTAKRRAIYAREAALSVQPVN
jgi:predicted S18 family serine protease